MSYHAVLSTIRELILDGIELPDSLSEREIFLRKHNSELSDGEVRDLAKIDPKRIEIYSNSIFAQERGVLKDKFKFSFALIRQRWIIKYGENFDFFALMKELHKKSPWRNNRTESLIKNFVSFIKEHRSDLIAFIPELYDTLRFELTKALIFRSNLSEPENNAACLKHLATLSVEEALRLNTKRIENTYIDLWHYDILALEERYKKEGEGALNEVLNPKEMLLIASRSPKLSVVWNYLPLGFFEPLKEEGCSLELLAQAYVGSQGEGLSEEQLFSSFIKLISKLVHDNAISLSI